MQKTKKQIQRARSSTRGISRSSATVRGKRAKFKAARSAAISKARAGARRIEKLKEKFEKALQPLRELLAEADRLANHAYELSGAHVPTGQEGTLQAEVATLYDAIETALDEARGNVETEIENVKELSL